MTSSRDWKLPFAISSIGLGMSSRWFWASLYHGQYSLATSLLTVLLFVSAVGVVSALAVAKHPRSRLPLRLLALLALASLLYAALRPYLDAELVSPAVRVAAYIACIVLILVARGWPDAVWRRVIRSSTVAGLVFAASFPLIGMSTSGEGAKVFSLGFLKQGGNERSATLVLLLDELSPESTDPIIEALTRRNLEVGSSSIVSAGTNTENIIPAMLTGRQAARTMPCGPSTLCTERSSLDFRKLEAASPATDIVGFYSPYCSIRGLRSCAVPLVEAGTSPARSLACSLMEQLVRLRCSDGPLATRESGDEHRRVRAAIRDSIRNAPFWMSGGLLYVHAPLPHPPGEVTTGNLRAEYQANLALSAQFVAWLADLLQSHFGRDFRLIITSDHPLRISLWCASSAYSRPNCTAGLPADRKRVPLIVASPDSIPHYDLTSNSGLLGDGAGH